MTGSLREQYARIIDKLLRDVSVLPIPNWPETVSWDGPRDEAADAILSITAPVGEWRTVQVEPTEAMLNAARDWSVKKYGQGIGHDAAIGCWTAMLSAAPLQGGE